MKNLMLTVVAGAALVAGCQTYTDPPGVGADPVPLQAYPKITASGGLNNYMVVNNLVVTRDGGLLNVETQVRWRGEFTSFYQYRYIFFDDQGRPLNSEPAWQRGRAAPGQVDYLSGNAVDPAATDWRLEIRRQA